MKPRLKILLSAYACEPGKGSEPEVGWQWAVHLARLHDVTVITRANNREAIERELPRLHEHQPVPHFVYHDESPALLRLKRQFRAHRIYYVRWQRSARRVVARLHREEAFDLIHHVTFAGYRFPTAIEGQDFPSVWGPVGGVESIPTGLLPWKYPRELLAEGSRNILNALTLTFPGRLRRRAQSAAIVVASTPLMQETFDRLEVTSQLMSAIGLDTTAIPRRASAPATGPLKLLFVGNLLALKGVDLALRALAISATETQFTIIGDGPIQGRLKQEVAQLDLGQRVHFLGRRPRAEVLQSYADYDALLFPSLHDTGGFAVIEAMAYGLPVICLNAGGPALAMQPDGGICVPLGSRSAVIAGLAQAIQTYDRDRTLLAAHGQNARRLVEQNYDWPSKVQQMDALYRQALLARRS